MDPRLPRLKKRSDFLKVAATRRKWVTTGVIVQIRSQRSQSASRPAPANTGGAGGSRIGFTVTKKVGNAVIRNRVRRRLRAAADQVFAAHARDQRDFVLIGRKGTIDRPFAALVRDMTFALKRLDAYRPSGEMQAEAAPTITASQTGGEEA